jgi:hypothetical protein
MTTMKKAAKTSKTRKSHYTVSLDEASARVLRRHGEGNLSEGIRRAAALVVRRKP